MAKFRHFEESRIHIGVGEIHVQEVDDGVHISISEEVDHSIRIGIPDQHGTSYNYWRDIVKQLRGEDTIKMSEDVVELEEDDLKQEVKKQLRPRFVHYKDKNIEFIAIELKDMNDETFLLSWEKNSDMPMPMTVFDPEIIKNTNQLGRVVFYQEFKKICDKVVSGS